MEGSFINIYQLKNLDLFEDSLVISSTMSGPTDFVESDRIPLFRCINCAGDSTKSHIRFRSLESLKVHNQTNHYFRCSHSKCTRTFTDNDARETHENKDHDIVVSSNLNDKMSKYDKQQCLSSYMS